MQALPAPIRAARERIRRRLARVVAVAFLAAATAAPACGLEDPSSISSMRGALNMAFPDALHVGTAVWQAQAAGTLPRDELLQRDDLAPEARATLRLFKANALMRQLAARLDDERGRRVSPRLAVVLIGPVLWTRFTAQEGKVVASFHAPGPEFGDVVVVTEAAVVEAIVRGDLTFAVALERRVARLYGADETVAAARAWLVAQP
jgi:hypothetical protein